MVEVVDKRDRAEIVEYEEFAPLLDRILVKRVEAEKEVEGFVVPERYRQHSNWGIVQAVGQGVVLGPRYFTMEEFVSVGDMVRYGEYSAEQFSLEDDGLWLVRVQDLRGVRRVKRG